jgi:predicted ATPase
LERGDRRYPYRETVALLAKALGLTPATAAEFEATAARPRQPHDRFDAQAAGGNVRRDATNLPLAPTSLIGRATEIADIVCLLQQKRLVTVTGAGGIGKTRTALAVGDALVDSMKAGVWLVEFAPLTSGSFVASAVAQALGVRELRNRPLLETLLTHLKQKPLLLIFDNCEHVIAEAAVLADALLARCPRIRVLATSREPLRIASEYAYRLPSLPVPTALEISQLSAEAAANFASVALFTQRAQAVDHRFVLNANNAPMVAEICRRLDGIALAIELAATRVNILPVRALLQKLDQRFRILISCNHTALPRHQTMRALIDWSYDLLAPPEQRLFERLSIFAGGCSLTAAATVCAHDEVDEFGVLELLSALVDKSLVVADLSGSEPRYRLLESVREYAREKLAARGEAALVAHYHAMTYVDLAEQLRREFLFAPDSAWFARAALELENWRAALEWTLGARGDIVLGQRLANATTPWWTFFSPVEGRRYLSAALELVDERTPTVVAASVENAAAGLAIIFGEFEEALAGSRRALPVFRDLGDTIGSARALLFMGKSLVNLGRVAEGEPFLHSALDALRPLGVNVLTAQTLQDIAVARSSVGDISSARAYLSEALANFTAIGGQAFALIAVGSLAEIEFRAGNAERAVQLMPALPQHVPPWYLVRYLLSLTAYLIACDRWDEAHERAREALEVARETQHDASLVWAIQHLTAIAALSTPGDGKVSAARFHNATRLLGYVDSRTADLGASREYAEQQEYDRVLRTLRCKIDTKDLVRLMAGGAVMTADQAVECVLSTTAPWLPRRDEEAGDDNHPKIGWP